MIGKTEIEYLPPFSVEAEQSVLGAIFTSKEAIFKVAEILKEEDFYKEAHRLIYKIACDLSANNEPIDFVTVIDRLKSNNQLEVAGGISYVTSVAGSEATAANVLFHAQIVKDKSTLRKIIQAGHEIIDNAYSGEDIDEIKEKSERLILNINNEKGKEFINKQDVLFDVFKQLQEISETNGGVTGLASGFSDIDKITGGFQNSDLILVAARPSMGKTAFVLNIASNITLRQNKPVAFFSLEMSAKQLLQRILCAEAAVDMQRLRQDDLKQEEWERIVQRASLIDECPIQINDTARTLTEIRSAARRMKAKQGLSLIIIDYIQLMVSDAKKIENRQQEITAISRGLKLLAKELDVPVIALSQLNRSVEHTQTKKPMLSDLRESGSLEQDADIVSFLYREDYYNPGTDKQNIAEFIIAKHRNGPVGTIELFFAKKFTRFATLERKRE